MRIIAAIVGQSNEQGAGETPSRTGLTGCPLRDPVAPNGSTGRSMWPYLSELMGQRGVWLSVHNSAKSGSSLTKSWCGHIANWTSGFEVVKGSYVVSSGGVWKCNLAGTGQATSTTQPAGTTNVTGTDGIPWIYIRTATEADAAQAAAKRVMQEGDSLFDPNGFVAAAYAGLSSASGYDQKWMFLSIGQTDSSTATTRAEFLDAYKSVTDFFLSRGVKCALGFTVYGGSEPIYQNTLLPAYADALSFYASNPAVVAGANLRASLGVLPTSPAAGVPGLKADALHMNDAAYTLASLAWRDALIAVGL